MFETLIHKRDLQPMQEQSRHLHQLLPNSTTRADYARHQHPANTSKSNDQIDVEAAISNAKFWQLLSQIQTGWLAQTQGGQQLFRRLPSCVSIFEIMTHAIETLTNRSDALETLVLAIAEHQAELHVQKHLRIIDKLILSVFSDSARVGILTKTDLIYLRRMPR